MSLRTASYVEAAARSLQLLPGLEAAETWVEMNMMSGRPLPVTALEQVVNEVLVRELTRIIQAQEGSLARSRAEAEAVIERLRQDQDEMKDEGARRDYARAKAPAAEAIAALGYHPSADHDVRQRVYARTFAAVRQANKFERRMEEGESAEESAEKASICPRLVSESRLRAAGRGVTVESGFDAAITKRYASSSDNQNHARSAKRIALDFWGNVPLSSLTQGDLIELLLFARRLPWDHGRKHGNNRYVSDRPLLTKHMEIALADAADAELRAEAERLNLSVREKEIYIRQKLRPRLSLVTLKKLHAFVRAAFKAARDHLDYPGDEIPVVFSAFKEKAKVAAENEAAEGRAILHRRRQRLSWSDERLASLFTSPIYKGSECRRRWRAGDTILRDSIYWCPLIVATAGLRPNEALNLLKSDVVLRNGVLAFHIHDSKTESSARYVPVPEVLLRLGFAEWVNGARERRGSYLFPEVADVDTQARLSEIFGGRFNSIRKGLEIVDEAEDFYALRRTFNSRLTAAGVATADCQALLGHKFADITNLHYTDRRLKELKEHVDKVNYRLTVAFSPAHGFPVIVSCRLDERAKVAVRIELDDHGYARRVSLALGAELMTVIIAPMKSWPSYQGEEKDPQAVTATQAAVNLAGWVGDREPKFSREEELLAWEYLMSLA